MFLDSLCCFKVREWHGSSLNSWVKQLSWQDPALLWNTGQIQKQIGDFFHQREALKHMAALRVRVESWLLPPVGEQGKGPVPNNLTCSRPNLLVHRTEVILSHLRLAWEWNAKEKNAWNSQPRTPSLLMCPLSLPGTFEGFFSSPPWLHALHTQRNNHCLVLQSPNLSFPPKSDRLTPECQLWAVTSSYPSTVQTI